MFIRKGLDLMGLLGFLLGAGTAQVTTSQYNNARTGANLQETVLTPQNVNPQTFGKIGELPVDGDVYAQPLYLPAVDIPGKGVHPVLYVATAGNNVYAFDVSGPPFTSLWHMSFTNPSAGITSVSSEDVDCNFIRPQVGITATPVIDSDTNTLYVLARTKERGLTGTAKFWQRLHALDTRTGAEKFGGPVTIQASIDGPKSLFGLIRERVEFNSLRENPRAGLALVNGQVVLTWGSSCDERPYHGWIIAYDAHTLKQTGVFNTSPDTADSGIWQSDAAPAVDSENNFLYVVTGNGVFTAAQGGRDYGDSILKLNVTNKGLSLRDFFTPFDQEELSKNDLDLGSGGAMIVPPQPDSKERLLIAAGKGDTIYVLDRGHLGGHRKNDNGQILQTLHACGSGAYGAPAYWNGSVYYLCSGDRLKQFSLNKGRLRLAKEADRAQPFTGLGATPTISAEGVKNGVVWAVECHQPKTSVAILHAYDASDISRELYNSNQTGQDYAGRAIRFAIPTVAKGRVYIGIQREVDIYGLLPRKNVHSFVR